MEPISFISNTRRLSEAGLKSSEMPVQTHNQSGLNHKTWPRRIVENTSKQGNSVRIRAAALIIGKQSIYNSSKLYSP